MIRYFNSAIGRLRLLGFLEGLSLLVLLGVAMPIKYIWQNPKWVQVIGSIHGALVILFVVYVLRFAALQNWSFFRTTIKVLISCFLPFGTFYIDKTIFSPMHHLAESKNQK